METQRTGMSLVVLFAVSLVVTQSPPPLVEAPNAAPLETSGPPPTPAPESTNATFSSPPLPSPATVDAPAAAPSPTMQTAEPAMPAPPLPAPSIEPAMSAPPLPAPSTVAAPPTPTDEPTTTPPPPPTAAASKAPLWEAGIWATATVPTALSGSAFMFGARAELDIWRIGVVGTFDRVGVTPFSIGDTNYWNAMVGYSVISTEFFRVRGLAGLSAVSGTSLTTRFAPSFGTTGRVLWHFIGAEAGATLTAGAFRQLDLRAAAILKGGVFELQLGYRARWIDTTTSGTIGSMFSASTASTDQAIASEPTAPALVAGRHVSIGFVF